MQEGSGREVGECKPNERARVQTERTKGGECKPNYCSNRVGRVTKNKTKKSLYILLTSGEELRDDLLSSRSRNASSASGAISVNAVKVIKDRAQYHYMDQVSSIAFDPIGQFATCQER